MHEPDVIPAQRRRPTRTRWMAGGLMALASLAMALPGTRLQRRPGDDATGHAHERAISGGVHRHAWRAGRVHGQIGRSMRL